MRMIKADNAFAAAPGQLERRNHLFRVNAVSVCRRVRAHVLASKGHGYTAVPAEDVPEQNPAALMRVATLGFPANQIVVSLADFQHAKFSWEVAASPV